MSHCKSNSLLPAKPSTCDKQVFRSNFIIKDSSTGMKTFPIIYYFSFYSKLSLLLILNVISIFSRHFFMFPVSILFSNYYYYELIIISKSNYHKIRTQMQQNILKNANVFFSSNFLSQSTHTTSFQRRSYDVVQTLKTLKQRCVRTGSIQSCGYCYYFYFVFFLWVLLRVFIYFFPTLRRHQF